MEARPERKVSEDSQMPLIAAFEPFLRIVPMSGGFLLTIT
jgi:hypothetical protein